MVSFTNLVSIIIADSSPDHKKNESDGSGTVPSGSDRFRPFGSSRELGRSSWSVVGAPEVFGRVGEAPNITLRHPRRPVETSSEAEVMHFLVAKVYFEKLTLAIFRFH